MNIYSFTKLLLADLWPCLLAEFLQYRAYFHRVVLILQTKVGVFYEYYETFRRFVTLNKVEPHTSNAMRTTTHWTECGADPTSFGFEFKFKVNEECEDGVFTGLSVQLFVFYFKWGIMEV